MKAIAVTIAWFAVATLVLIARGDYRRNRLTR
jgi:hypothetical protein